MRRRTDPRPSATLDKRREPVFAYAPGAGTTAGQGPDGRRCSFEGIPRSDMSTPHRLFAGLRLDGIGLAGALTCALVASTPAAAAKRAPKAAPKPAPVRETLPMVRPTPFSTGPVAATAPAGWTLEIPPKVERGTRYDLIPEHGLIVLRARADASNASLRHGLFADPKLTPTLQWRWRTERTVQNATLGRKDYEDSAARVCVYFDRDPETMTLKERTRLKLERTRHGNRVPTAGLCYVWDNQHPVNTILDSAETPFVAMVVASSGPEHLGRWQTLQRDVVDDYRRAYNTDPPRIIGVSVAVDTADTGEPANTWFGDIAFVGARSR